MILKLLCLQCECGECVSESPYKDCKEGSSTVSKRAPAADKQAP